MGPTQERLTVGDPTAMEPQRNADRQVDARNRFAGEILRCKNHQIRAAPTEIRSRLGGLLNYYSRAA